MLTSDHTQRLDTQEHAQIYHLLLYSEIICVWSFIYALTHDYAQILYKYEINIPTDAME